MKKDKNLDTQIKRAFQTGGYNPPAVPQPYGPPGRVNPQTGTFNLSGYGTRPYQTPSSSTTGYIPYAGATPLIRQPVQFTGPQFQTATQATNFPTFGETVGTKVGQYDELRTYVNDAGQILRIPFKNGQPIYPIPEGYRPQDGQPAAEQTTTVPITQTVTNQSDGGGDGDGMGVAGSVQGPASTATGLSGVQSALSGITGYFSGAPAQAQPYGGTTLSGLTNLGTITDFSNNISGVQDALGVYGTGPINLGIVGSMLTGNPLGALASASGIGPSTESFGQAAPAGFGAFSTDQLNDYVSGKMSPIEMQATGIAAMDKSQAQARAQVQRAIGVEITGVMGYKRGDISPITGTPVNSKGRVVNFNGSSTGVDPGFATMGDWVDALEASVSSGYYGGPLSKAEVANLSTKGKKGYAAKAKELGYDPQGEGPPGSGGPAAEADSYGTPPGGTGKGRSDYTGGNAGTPSDDVGVGSPGGSAVSGQETAGSPGAESNDDSPGGGYGSDGGAGGGGNMGVICLTEDMKVKRNGVIDFVTEVQVGDIIDNTVVTEVLHKHMREGYYKVNGELKITNDHPVLANGAWKRTEDLVLGDRINNVEVTSLEYVEQVTPTVYIGTAEDRYDVYTEGEVYTVHGQYKNALKKAA